MPDSWLWSQTFGSLPKPICNMIAKAGPGSDGLFQTPDGLGVIESSRAALSFELEFAGELDASLC